MDRLTRAEMQEVNRRKVLAAAHDEFADRGFRDAKIDGIADRAGLTRGAVYSNFPGKRALYFAVLADLAERAPAPPPPGGETTAPQALGAFARAWLARLPLTADDGHQPGMLGRDLIPEIAADEGVRQVFAQLMRLDALLLGLCLERLRPAGRLVPVAEAVLTTLHGASQMAVAAPGFGDPFDVAAVCEQFAGLDLDTGYFLPYLPWIPKARPVDEPWRPPAALDSASGAPATLTGDGVVAVLGLHRIEAAEEAVRAAPGARVTAVLVTGDPAELGPLARMTLAETRHCLHGAFPAWSRPRLQVVYDERAALAAAAGVSAVSDATETAVRIASGRVVARAEGRGACHAAARLPGCSVRLSSPDQAKREDHRSCGAHIPLRL